MSEMLFQWFIASILHFQFSSITNYFGHVWIHIWWLGGKSSIAVAFRVEIRMQNLFTIFCCGDFSSYRTRWHWMIFQRRNHRRRHQGLLEGFHANGRFITFFFELIRSKFWRLNDGIVRYLEKFRILAESTFPFSCFANDKSIAIMKIRNPDSGTRSNGIIRHVTIWQHFWNNLISRKNDHASFQIESEVNKWLEIHEIEFIADC